MRYDVDITQAKSENIAPMSTGTKKNQGLWIFGCRYPCRIDISNKKALKINDRLANVNTKG